MPSIYNYWQKLEEADDEVTPSTEPTPPSEPSPSNPPAPTSSLSPPLSPPGGLNSPLDNFNSSPESSGQSPPESKFIHTDDVWIALKHVLPKVNIKKDERFGALKMKKEKKNSHKTFEY